MSVKVPQMNDRATAAADDPFQVGDIFTNLAPTQLDALGHPDALATTGVTRADCNGVPAECIPIVEATRYGHEKKAAYLNDWEFIVSQSDGTAVGVRLPEGEPADLPSGVERRLYEAPPPWPDSTRTDRRVSGSARQRLEDLGYV